MVQALSAFDPEVEVVRAVRLAVAAATQADLDHQPLRVGVKGRRRRR
jgi:hypothetical protein